MTLISQMIGVPYLKGGRDLNGLDCVGVVLYYYQHALGITLPDPAIHGWDRLASLFTPCASPGHGDVVLMHAPTLHLGVAIGAKVLHAHRLYGVVAERTTYLGIIGSYRYDRRSAQSV